MKTALMPRAAGAQETTATPQRSRTRMFLFRPDASLSESESYRLIAPAVLVGGLAWMAVYGLSVAAWHSVHSGAWFPDHSLAGVWSDMSGGFDWLLNRLTFGHAASDTAEWWGNPAEIWNASWSGFHGGVMLPDVVRKTGIVLGILAGACAGTYTARSSCTPQMALRVVSGPRLLDGAAAFAALRANSAALTNKQRARPDNRYALPLGNGDEAVWLSKKAWSNGVLIEGAVGSGKSQIIKAIIGGMFRARSKVLAFDAKGEYVEVFLKSGYSAILAPHDARSIVWDVAHDVGADKEGARTAANRFAMMVDTGSSSGTFFRKAVARIYHGALMMLQQKNSGTAWGWSALHAAVSGTRQELYDRLNAAGFGPYVSQIATQTPTSDAIMSSLANASSMIEVLADAWPDDQNRPIEQRFSVREWCRDTYDRPGGRKGPRMVFLKADGDTALASLWIGLMVNMAEAEINGTSLTDNQTGRSLGLVFDELSSLSKLDLEGVVARARSRGAVTILGYQSARQIVQRYGEDELRALQAMSGVRLCTRMSQGQDRDDVARHFGTQRVAWSSHLVKAHGAEAHEREQQVVPSDFLTSGMGDVELADGGFGVRCLVRIGTRQGDAQDVLALTLRGRAWPTVAPRYVAAAWINQPGVAVTYTTALAANPAAQAPTAPAPAGAATAQTPTAPNTASAAAEAARNAILTRHAPPTDGPDMGWVQ